MNAELRNALTACSTATITMQLLKRGLRATAMSGVAPLTNGQGRLVGEAYTVRFIPMREDLSAPANLGARENPQRRAIEECPPGAILVMDGLGNRDAGTLGDILAERPAGARRCCLRDRQRGTRCRGRRGDRLSRVVRRAGGTPQQQRPRDG